MNYRGFKTFSNYIESVPESRYNEIDSYIKILDSYSRISNQCIYLLDFYKGEVIYISYNPQSFVGIDAEDIKDVNRLHKKGYISTDEFELMKHLVKSWFEFLESKPVGERKDYTMQFDYHLNKRLMNINMTPTFLSNEGKPWLVICNSKISTNQTAEKSIIFKLNSTEHWIYNKVTKRWVAKTNLNLSEIEQEILRLSLQGKTENEICELIFKSKDGLKSIKRRMFSKMEVRNIIEATSLALSYGLI